MITALITSNAQTRIAFNGAVGGVLLLRSLMAFHHSADLCKQEVLKSSHHFPCHLERKANRQLYRRHGGMAATNLEIMAIISSQDGQELPTGRTRIL